MQKLVLIRGLPGTGKSTLAKTTYQSYQHFEADMFFMHNGKYVFRPDHVRQAHAWCRTATRMMLVSGRSVVVSNTFTQRWEVQPYLDMAAELGAEVEIVTLTTRFTNIHGMPEAAIARMAARWEEIEGF